jgi:DNA-binding transcriptional LysR family regulator
VSAEHIIEEIEELAHRLRTRFRGESGRLTIGVHTSLSAGNLRATLIEHHRRFPEVETRLVDGSSHRLISELANSAVDVAFLLDDKAPWQDKSLSVWSERVIAALPAHHPLSGQEAIRWSDLVGETILVPLRGPGPEILRLLITKIGCSDPDCVSRHDVSLDRFLTLVGAGLGILLALDGATGAIYPGVVFREIRDVEGPTRLAFRACWRQENCNPPLQPFLDTLRERYPDISTIAALG